MGMEDVVNWALQSFFAGSCLLFCMAFNQFVPVPYMDEIFHVPQSQVFCNWTMESIDDIEWDPKITTLPGSYVTMTYFLSMIPFLGKDYCTINNLRGINAAFGVMNFFILIQIIGVYMPRASEVKKTFVAINIATMPVLYFFNFLYYTDVVSTTYLLSMHLFYLQERFTLSAFGGGLAVLTRQTNVIWVLWHGLMAIWDAGVEILETFCLDGNKMESPRSPPLVESESTGVQESYNRKYLKFPPLSLQSAKSLVTTVYGRIMQKDILDRAAGYFLVGVGFVLFVILNGSIVVGDKEFHQATFNFPQMGYFSLFYGVFTVPYFYRQKERVVTLMIENRVKFLLLSVMFTVAACFNTVAHPFLLADNRHYPFYLWRAFMWNPFNKVFITAPYIVLWAFIWTGMDADRKYKITVVICCALSLIPQSLLEFRYFIPAYLFIRLARKDATWFELVQEFSLSVIVNWFTIAKFLFDPFFSRDNGELSRFMW